MIQSEFLFCLQFLGLTQDYLQMTAVVRLFYLYSSLLNVADEAHSHRQRREMVGCYSYESLVGHLLSFATRLYHHGGSLGAKVNEDDAKVT